MAGAWRAHSRASLADALATVTPALTRPAAGAPPAAALRAALYGHAFNPHPRATATDPATARRWPGWSGPRCRSPGSPTRRCTRQRWMRSTLRLDGSRAAANTITRKRAVFHGALGYAVETGLLRPTRSARSAADATRAATAVDPADRRQPRAGARPSWRRWPGLRPELTAFFGCLYYARAAPRRSRRAAQLADCSSCPARGWGKLTLTAACPRTGSRVDQQRHAVTSRAASSTAPTGRSGSSRSRRSWSPCSGSTCRCYGTAPDGRLFRGARGGLLSESSYGRTWHAARDVALGPELAATTLARRPYDLRHAALSLWLNATGAPPAEVAARAGHSVHVLLAVYAHCIPGHCVPRHAAPGSSRRDRP